MSSRQKFTITCEKSGSPRDTIRKTETGPPSYIVVETISEIKNTAPEYLEPLYSILDPDALDQMFQRADQDEPHQSVKVSFSYEEYEVTINSEDKPTISEKSSPPSHIHE